MKFTKSQIKEIIKEEYQKLTEKKNEFVARNNGTDIFIHHNSDEKENQKMYDALTSFCKKFNAKKIEITF